MSPKPAVSRSQYIGVITGSHFDWVAFSIALALSITLQSNTERKRIMNVLQLAPSIAILNDSYRSGQFQFASALSFFAAHRVYECLCYIFDETVDFTSRAIHSIVPMTSFTNI